MTHDDNATSLRRPRSSPARAERRGATPLAAYALIGAACIALAPAAAAQTRQTIACPVDAQRPQPLAMGRELLGASICTGCHVQGTAKLADAKFSPFVPQALVQQAVHDNWVRGDEWVTWNTQDRHVQAFTTLLGERSQRIGKILGIADVHRDARCLACHSSLPAASVARSEFVVDAAYFADDGSEDRTSLGVSCEACHGASGRSGGSGGELAGWVDRHVVKSQWRYLAPEEKRSDFGFYDVRSPASRADMCLSCHLGDARQGRLVTHAMYAAGHPPLPSFELNAFVAMMPAHWRDLGSSDAAEPPAADPAALLGRKPKAITAEFLQKTADPFFQRVRQERPEVFSRWIDDYAQHAAATRSMAVGALAAWSAQAELDAALMSAEEAPLLPARNRWPELAQFECSACHHELRRNDWRQAENPAAPGRPVLRDWSAPVVRAVLATLAPGDAAEFERRLTAIERAATATPYGRREALAPLMRESSQWLAEVAAKIEAEPVGRAEAAALVRALADQGAARPLDYDAARQLAWALAAALSDADPDAQWPAVRQAAAALDGRFVLDLATAEVRAPLATLSRPGAGGASAVEIDLGKLLPAAASHDGGAVRDAFAKIAAAAQGGTANGR